MEKAVEMPVVHRAERAGWFVRKLRWVGRVGAPDRLFIKDGRVVWIEFKDTGEKLRKLQAVERKEMEAAGAEIYCCDSVREALALLGIT